MSNMTDAFAQAVAPTESDSETFYFSELGDCLTGKIVRVEELNDKPSKSKYNVGGTESNVLIEVQGGVCQVDVETLQPTTALREGTFTVWMRTHQNGQLKQDSLVRELAQTMKRNDMTPHVPKVGADITIARTHEIETNWNPTKGYTVKYALPETAVAAAFGASVEPPAQAAPVAQPAPAPAAPAAAAAPMPDLFKV